MKGMKVNKAYSFRIYPNEDQEVLISKTLGCTRYIFNYFLGKRRDLYNSNKETYTYYDCCAELTQMKKNDDTIWLKEVDAIALQSSVRHLDYAYINFYRRVKNGEKPR